MDDDEVQQSHHICHNTDETDYKTVEDDLNFDASCKYYSNVWECCR
jgi:hypothetical protein